MLIGPDGELHHRHREAHDDQNRRHGNRQPSGPPSRPLMILPTRDDCFEPHALQGKLGDPLMLGVSPHGAVHPSRIDIRCLVERDGSCRDRDHTTAVSRLHRGWPAAWGALRRGSYGYCRSCGSRHVDTSTVSRRHTNSYRLGAEGDPGDPHQVGSPSSRPAAAPLFTPALSPEIILERVWHDDRGKPAYCRLPCLTGASVGHSNACSTER